MEPSTIQLIGMGVWIIIVGIVLIWFGISLMVLIRLKKKYVKDTTLLHDLKEANQEKVVEYSKQLLDFIRMMVSQIAVIRFRTFVDNNDMSKITKSSIEKLVHDVASTVKQSINISNVSIENTVYSEEFFDRYIVETSVIMVKDLLDKAIGIKSDGEE